LLSYQTYQIVREAFKEVFIFYKAKDIISGDFYWFRTITLEDKEYKIIVAVDCTGHGVPGAIMTIVGYFLLERIIEKENIVKPHQILKALNKGIIEAFMPSPSYQNSKVREGMDASVLVIENEQTIYYAGANRPLYFRTPKNETIQIIEGSRAALGGEQRKREKMFSLTTLDYQKGSQFYLFSDGYPDQFGGKNDKKLGSKHFRKLLNENQSESMSQMHTEIKLAFETWKDETSQTDDVMVIGIEI
jgi:serine phosphatase RsbU (regulator of sigma subunit)